MVQTRSIKILLAGNTASDIDEIKYHLRRLERDYKLTTTTGFEIFKNHYSKRVPDLVIVDLDNPDYNGSSILNFVRQKSPYHPIFIISDKLDESSVIRFIVENKANDHFRKNDLNRLHSSVEREVLNLALKLELKDKTDSLRKSEMLLKETQKLAKLGSWSMDLNTLDVQWSDEMFRIFEVDKSLGTPDLEELRSFYHPDDVDLFKEPVYNKKYQRYKLEGRIFDSNGNLKYVEISGDFKFDKNNEPYLVMGTLRDITESKKAQLKIKQKDEQLKNITNNINVLVLKYVLYPNGTDAILYVNDVIEELGEIPKSAPLEDTANVWSLVHPDDIEGVKQSVVHSAQNMILWEKDFRVITPSGTLKWLSSKGTPEPQPDGSVQWDTVIIDVTEEKKVQDSIKESERKIRALLHTSPVGIYLIDAKGIVTDFWNHTAEQIFGYKKEEVIGNFLPYLGEDDLQEYYTIIDQIQQGEVLRNKRLKRTNKEGNDIFIEINTSPLFDEQNNLENVLVIVSDVSPLVEKENSLKRSLAEKELLLAEVHHRVKNNLAIITGLLNLQGLQLKNDELSGILAETSLRIKSIANIHELLYNEESLSDIPFKQYVHQLGIEIISSMTMPQAVELEVNMDDINVNINQAIPLGILFNELITNSLKYAFDDHDDALISISIDYENSEYTVSYCDNGPGFEEANFERTNSLGTTLIRTLLAQLDADYSINSDNQFRLDFKFKEVVSGAHGNLTEVPQQ